MKKLIFILLILRLGCYDASSQYFQTGQDPASLRWRQLDAGNFRLIYPDYYERGAQILAGKLNAVYPYGSYTMKHNPRKIPIVLHTRTVQSNGLVALAPWRSEFYTLPHQSVYPQDWLEQLALHEFRHVVQIDKVRSNQPRWLRFLLGEQGTALAMGIYLPWWFIEGDAVITETTLSQFGRGRSPSFLMEHRAQVVEKGVFSYDKASFGSYRDFVPNHYKLGYYLTGNIRARYGSRVWEEVLTRTGKKPFTAFPMRTTLKEHTGKNVVQNYQSVFDSLKTEWREEDQKFTSVPFKEITKPRRYFTGYTHSHYINDSVIGSYRRAFDGIPSFVHIDRNGAERKILNPGPIFNESSRFYGEWIVWSEETPDLRWHHAGRSLIRLYHPETKRRMHVKPEFTAFSPALSPGLESVAVVEADYESNYYLSVYSLPDGELLHRFQTQENNYLISPEWISETAVAVIILTGDGKQLASVDFETGQMELLTERDLHDLKQLRSAGEWLYFISSYTGKNSLFRINLTDRRIEQVYEPRFEVESPAVSPDGERVVISDYTSNGFRLIEIAVAPESVLPYGEAVKGSYPLAELLTRHEDGIPLFADSVAVESPSEKYHKAANLFHFHSWAPVYIDANAYQFSPGVSLMSQNILGTAETVVGYRRDLAEKTGRFLVNYSYKGWFPMFDLKLEHGSRASDYRLIRQTINNSGEIIRQDTILQRFTWKETTAGMNIRVPLRLSRGAWNRMVQPEVYYSMKNSRKQDPSPANFREGTFHTVGYRIYLHQLLRQSYLAMYPDFGVVLDAQYRHSPAGSLSAGEMRALQSVVYLPGFMKNHGIKIYGGVQRKENDGVTGFSDVVMYARGWGRIPSHSLRSLAGDYKLPLFYPDLNVFGLLYIRRVNASLFVDKTWLEGNFYRNGTITGSFTDDLTSMGTELTANLNLLRFYAPVTAGFRASWLPEKESMYFHLLFSIDFTSF